MNCRRHCKSHFAALFATAALLAPLIATAEEPPVDAAMGDSPRRTETVKLIERCLPAVVSIRTFTPHEKPGVFYISAGSGALIHEAGYVLTNAHVVKNMVQGDVTLTSGRAYPYRVVAALPHEDMALIKIDAEGPLPYLPLGRSHDLMLGEPVLVLGNPDGLAQSASTGIISGLNRATATQDAFLPWTVQTTAAINGGNSGGPLINALGEQIGVVTSKKNDADNIGFAIAIDRIRQMFPRMLAAEQRYGFQLGIAADMLDGAAKVAAVTEGSPAAQAGVLPGDIIRQMDDRAIRQGLDFQLALIDRQPTQALKLALGRGDQTMETSLTLAALVLTPPTSDEGKAPGLHFAAYTGQWTELPDFNTLQPVAEGKAEKPALAAYQGNKEQFGLVFTGFVKAPADGLYTFSTLSDDGSRLLIDGASVVENGGLHAPRESAGLVRLAAGLHSIRLEFFEATGDEALQVFMEGPGLPKQEIPATAFFVDVK